MAKNVSYDDVANSLSFNKQNNNTAKPTFLQKRMLTKLTSMNNMESILESKESVRSPTVSGTNFQLNLEKLSSLGIT